MGRLRTVLVAVLVAVLVPVLFWASAPTARAADPALDITIAALGGNPWGSVLTPDGTALYVSGNLQPGGVIWRIDTATHQVAYTITSGLGLDPRGLAISPDGTRLYVAQYQSASIAVIDTAADTVVSTIALANTSAPLAIAIAPDGQHLFVSDHANPVVYVVDTATQNYTFTLVQQAPGALAISPDGSEVYVPGSGSSYVSVIDTATTAQVSMIPVPTGPDAVAVSPDGAFAYVTSNTANTVTIIDLRQRAVVTSTTVPGAPGAIAVSPDGTRLFVTQTSLNSVTVLDAATLAPVSGSPVSVGSLPVTITLSPTGPQGYVANYSSSTLSVLDTGMRTVTFDAAGGSGTMPPQYGFASTPLRANAFARDGYVFAGWLADGSGTPYADRAPYSFAGDATLVAQWAPLLPPSAPTLLSALPADGSAVVTWTPPMDSGSYPVSTYQAIASPGGRTCLATAPATTCTITGLANGTTYTGTVRALNGAGWGPSSSASAPFTPQRAPQPWLKLAKGTRTPDGRHDRITVTGRTAHVPAGTRLTPYLRYEGGAFVAGEATITVAADGTFGWTRLVKASKGLTAYVAWGDVASNQRYWPPVR